MENFGAHAHGLGKRVGPDGQDHAFLNIDVVVGVRPAVQQVNQRNGHVAGIGTAQVGIKRQAGVRRSGFRRGQGSAKDGVGAEA